MITGDVILDYVTDGSKRAGVFILILVLTFFVQRLVASLIHKSFHKSSKFMRVDETKYRFFGYAVSGLIYLIGIGFAIYSIPTLRSLSTSIFAGAGILAAIIGFASQAAFSNIISGIMIVFSKPFGVGDRITIADMTGVVEDITLRHTVIRNFENKRVIIPNAIISSEKIENFSIHDAKICKIVEFSVSYDTNLDKAMKIIQEAAENTEYTIDNRDKKAILDDKPKVQVRVVSLGNSGITIKAWVWVKNSIDAFEVACYLNKKVKEDFDKAGIEIPFPYMTLVHKKDLEAKAKKKK